LFISGNETRFLGHASRTLVTIPTAKLRLRNFPPFPIQNSFCNLFFITHSV